MRAWILAMLIWPGLALAGGRAGEFDYYVLALSWSPNWCALEQRDVPQCDAGRDVDWVLHGLWPQYERGYPSDCPSIERAPSRRETRAQADLFGSSGSAWHQWNKHGRCSGLSSRAYYDLAQEAFDTIVRPEVLRNVPNRITLRASLIEEAFLRDNPDLSADGLVVTCAQGGIQEVRICLTKDLEPRACGRDLGRDCALQRAWLEPVR